jgi:hypothetical protein
MLDMGFHLWLYTFGMLRLEIECYSDYISYHKKTTLRVIILYTYNLMVMNEMKWNIIIY